MIQSGKMFDVNNITLKKLTNSDIVWMNEYRHRVFSIQQMEIYYDKVFQDAQFIFDN